MGLRQGGHPHAAHRRHPGVHRLADPLSQAQPGDLLTWKNDPTFNGVSHIAIYLGGNKMVVAPHTGTDVQIQTVYTRNFWGAIRVNPQLAARKAGA